MISYVIPTRDRSDRLDATLRALEALGDHHAGGGAEVIIVDNASATPPRLPTHLAGSIPVHPIRLPANIGAAARNHGVNRSDPRSAWIVMLDDDSHPRDLGFIPLLARQPSDVGAVSADIFLPNHATRESGGLPEVFIGCGVAIRRSLFLSLHGYDPSFNYYAEEYDLAARVLLSGFRVAFEPRFQVDHHKVSTGRDMNLIVSRLVRNNGWVMQRYAPESRRRDELREIRRRYRSIASKEHALRGFSDGLIELRRTIRSQHRTPMPDSIFDRFTGLTHAREAITAAAARSRFTSAAVIDEGKNCWAVRTALAEHGARFASVDTAEALVIGTMSPGPMLDALSRAQARYPGRRIIAPWSVADTVMPVASLVA